MPAAVSLQLACLSPGQLWLACLWLGQRPVKTSEWVLTCHDVTNEARSSKVSSYAPPLSKGTSATLPQLEQMIWG